MNMQKSPVSNVITITYIQSVGIIAQLSLSPIKPASTLKTQQFRLCGNW